MGWIGNVLRGVGRSVVSFAPTTRKKGARRRTNWDPKLLRNRLYKGSGSGTMMSKVGDTFLLNKNKIRHFQVRENTSDFKPYVCWSCPKIPTPAPTHHDFLAMMEHTFDDEAKLAFASVADRHLGLKSGKFGKWGA